MLRGHSERRIGDADAALLGLHGGSNSTTFAPLTPVSRERAVKDVLGEKGYTSLERNNGAWWLRNLSPDAPAPTKQP